MYNVALLLVCVLIVFETEVPNCCTIGVEFPCQT